MRIGVPSFAAVRSISNWVKSADAGRFGTERKAVSPELIKLKVLWNNEVFDDTNAECLNYYYHKLAHLISYFSRPGELSDFGCSRV
jgi:hypothetical protein